MCRGRYGDFIVVTKQQSSRSHYLDLKRRRGSLRPAAVGAWQYLSYVSPASLVPVLYLAGLVTRHSIASIPLRKRRRKHARHGRDAWSVHTSRWVRRVDHVRGPDTESPVVVVVVVVGASSGLEVKSVPVPGVVLEASAAEPRAAHRCTWLFTAPSPTGVDKSGRFG